jgi:hypothetical protein
MGSKECLHMERIESIVVKWDVIMMVRGCPRRREERKCDYNCQEKAK